jgi:hypothetical protein
MTVRTLAVAATVIALAAPAAASPLVVVVRDSADAALAVARLRGQLADLDVRLSLAPGAVEAALDAQIAAAARLATERGARAVVWFIARHGGLAVAIATPADHRLFVREIPAADPSAVAEAAAVAARGALRAIGDGGTIGVEVPVVRPAEPTAAPARIGLALGLGWQVALDGGADAGAHAIAQRTTVSAGAWAASLALSWGPALRHAVDTARGVSVQLARAAAALGVERRLAGFALGVSAGVAVYRRATSATPSDLAATPAATTAAFIAGPELRWQWRPDGSAIGVAAAAGIDIVVGAPELAVARGADIMTLGTLRTVQPRVGVSVIAELR